MQCVTTLMTRTHDFFSFARGTDKAQEILLFCKRSTVQSVSQSFFAIATRPPDPSPSGNRHTVQHRPDARQKRRTCDSRSFDAGSFAYACSDAAHKQAQRRTCYL